MTYIIPSPEGDCILYVCQTARVSISQPVYVASVANASYIIILLYNSTVSMVTDAIHMYAHLFIYSCTYICVQYM